MPLASQLIAVGVPPAQAEQLGYGNLTAVTAVGTTQVTATAIKEFVTQVEVTASPSNTGVRLPADVEFQQDYFILNSSATTASVYPPTGCTINGGSTNAAVTIGQNVSMVFARLDRTRWIAQTTAGMLTGLTVATANGFAGSVSGGLTPQITLSTTQTGAIVGNGTALVGYSILPTANGGMANVATRSAMAALDTSIYTLANLLEAGRQGPPFQWNPANLSTQVTADPQQGVYVPPTGTPSGASGAWVRIYTGPLSVLWFGAKVDGTTEDQVAINAAIFLANALGGGQVLLGNGTSIIGPAGTSAGNSYGVMLLSNVHLRGAGQFLSTLKTKDNTTGVLVVTSLVLGPASQNIIVSDLTLDGNRSGGVTNLLGMGIWPYNVTNLTLYNLYVFNSATFGVRPQSVAYFSISNILIDNTADAFGTDCFHAIDCSYGNISGVTALGYGDDIFVIDAEGFDCHDIVATDIVVVGSTATTAGGNGVTIFSNVASDKAIYNIDITAVTHTCKASAFQISTRSTGSLDASNIRVSVRDYGSVNSFATVTKGTVHNCIFDIGSINATTPMNMVVGGSRIMQDNVLRMSVYNPADGALGSTLIGDRWDASITVNYDPLGTKVSPSLALDMFATNSKVKCDIIGGSYNIFVRSAASGNTFDIVSLSGSTTAAISNSAGAVGNSFVGGKVTGVVTDNDGTARFYGSPSFEGYGTASVTTDASGNANIAHGLAATPRTASVTILGDVAYQVDVQSVSSTNVVVRLKNPATNADVAATQSVLWRASI